MSSVDVDRLPNLIGIGAAKSGTSALHAYLSAHPQISMSTSKELKLFGSSDWNRRLEWYASQFELGTPVRGETSPTYSMDPYVPGVPEQMAAVLNDPRFVYVVGDPVERAVAHWREQRMMTYERRSLAEAFADADDPLNPYVAASRYGHQLSRYLSVFPAEKVLVVDQEDLRHKREETLERLFEFAGVETQFWHAGYDREPNATTEKLQPNRFSLWLLDRTGAAPWARRLVVIPGLTASRPRRSESLGEATRTRLEAALRPDLERFRELTGQAFAHWSV